MFRILIFLVSAYLFVVLFLYFVQRQLIYYPEKTNLTPSDMGISEMQTILLHTSDDLMIKAWYKKPQQNKPTLIYFHGNAGHIANRAFLMKPFLDEGYGVLLLTYRGYSGNPGAPSEQGLYRDAKAAIDYVLKQGIDKCKITLYGNSIGSAVAAQMATEYDVGAIILQSPFTSLKDVGNYHFPYLPVGWFLKDKYNAVNTLQNIKSPILIIYGTHDEIMPPKFSKELYKKFPGSKKLIEVPGRGHNDLFIPGEVIQFINQTIRC